MSSNIIINGSAEAIRQPDAYRKDPVRGWQTVIRYQGPKAKIFALANSFEGCTVDIFSSNGVVWELQAVSPTALDGSTEAPVNIWESSNTFTNKGLEASPAFSGVSGPNLKIIDDWLKSSHPDGAEPTPALPTTALTLLRLKQRGTNYTVYQPILRHTQVVSSLYAVQTAYTNIGRIFTDPGAPSDFLVGLPASGASSRPAINGDGTEFIFGWLKKPPTAGIAAYNKRQIVQDWEFGEYNVFDKQALL